jgi:ribosomal protein S18 acetylase RimI-like enzyme
VFLEAAGEEDLAALVELERRSFSQPWSVGSFRAELRDPARGRIVVLREPHADPDGRRGLLAFCSFQVVVDELHILDFAVLPERRREGLGRSLLRCVLELGARRGARVARQPGRAAAVPRGGLRGGGSETRLLLESARGRPATTA